MKNLIQKTNKMEQKNNKKNYEFKVSATIDGKKIVTNKGLFKNKREATIYADATNKFHKGAKAKVIKQNI